jgi:shikimate dehydrogenase
LKAARARGLKAIEGLDMLIGQARPSFRAFFGVDPPDAVDARSLLENARPANAPAPWPAAWR